MTNTRNNGSNTPVEIVWPISTPDKLTSLSAELVLERAVRALLNRPEIDALIPEARRVERRLQASLIHELTRQIRMRDSIIAALCEDQSTDHPSSTHPEAAA